LLTALGREIAHTRRARLPERGTRCRRTGHLKKKDDPVGDSEQRRFETMMGR
jgi:hypothetical protein